MGKNNGTGLLIGAGAILTLLFVKKGVQAKKLDTSIDSIRAKKSGTNILLEIKLAVYNPNESPIKFNRFVGNVYSDTKRIADVDVNTPALLEARATSYLIIPVTIPIARLTANILEALNKLLDKAPTQLLLKGVMYAENIRVPVEETFNLNLQI